ncbi:hypothetical protein ACFPZ3_33285, partial [Nonomuraea insulae]
GRRARGRPARRPPRLTLIGQIHELGVPVMGDVSTLEEGLAAWEAGADLVGTTLSGYTARQLPTPYDPDLHLVGALASHGVRVIAEGRYRTEQQVRQAFAAGAWAVVVGGAITDPISITRRLAAAAPRHRRTARTAAAPRHRRSRWPSTSAVRRSRPGWWRRTARSPNAAGHPLPPGRRSCGPSSSSPSRWRGGP